MNHGQAGPTAPATMFLSRDLGYNNTLHCIVLYVLIYLCNQIHIRNGTHNYARVILNCVCSPHLGRNVKSSYGFELLQVFQQAGIEVNEGTLYPLLNRMYKNGWLVSKWETPSLSGHPRRYYELSRVGKSVLPKMLNANTLNQQSLEQLGKLI